MTTQRLTRNVSECLYSLYAWLNFGVTLTSIRDTACVISAVKYGYDAFWRNKRCELGQ